MALLMNTGDPARLSTTGGQDDHSNGASARRGAKSDQGIMVKVTLCTNA